MSDTPQKVLALRYRPKSFDDLIGQKSVTQTLSLALDSNKLSHAYLFSGLKGSGKTSTARILARALICTNRKNHNPCNECDNCKSAIDGRHIDIIELDAASNRKIDDIRDLIEQTHYVPSTAAYKIFIIDEVHMLTKEAFNALLKTLEEPPDFVRFILATTDPLKLPATILSRTQHFRFKKISHKDTIKHLSYILNKEGVEYENAALDVIARSANGSLRDTLTILDQAIVYSKGIIGLSNVVAMLGILDPQKTKELFALILGGEKERALEFILEFEDFDAQALLDEMINYLKDQLLSKEIPLQIIGKFFSILSNAKILLSIGTDAGFAFSLSVLQMIEASKPTTQAQQVSTQTKQAVKPQPQPSPQPQKQNKPQPQEQTSSKQTMWEALVDELYKRDLDLGEVFSNNITLCDFDANVLSWHSKAQGEDKQMLGRYFGVIKELVAKVFGSSVSIKAVKTPPQQPQNEPQSKQEPQAEPKPQQRANTQTSMDDVFNQTDPSTDLAQKAEPQTKQEPQPSPEPQVSKPQAEPTQTSSSIDDVFGGEQTAGTDLAQKDDEATQVLEEPFVKKAMELFNPSGIRIAKK